jgi:DNA-binding MarR family transcriptional regulator
MGKILRQRLHQSRFESPIQEAILNVMVASGHLRDLVDRIGREHEVTGSQYNVLRILRGAQPDGLPRCEIATRLLDRAPDVTRLIDKLEKAGLVERRRSEQDARQSIARVTRRGLALLERMDVDIRASHRLLQDRLTERETEQLSLLLEKLYEGEL